MHDELFLQAGSAGRSVMQLRRPAPVGADDPEQQQGCERAECVCKHILLRIPDITLRAEKFDAGITAVGHGIPPLYDLIAGSYTHDQKQAEKACHYRSAQPLFQQPFGHGKGIETNAEVTDAVKMVALETELFSHPAEGGMGKGIVAADGVPEEPKGHQCIGRMAEAEQVEAGSEGGKDDDDRNGFGQPDIAGDRRNAHPDKKQQKHAAQQLRVDARRCCVAVKSSHSCPDNGVVPQYSMLRS